MKSNPNWTDSFRNDTVMEGEGGGINIFGFHKIYCPSPHFSL